MPLTFAHPAAAIPLLKPLGRYGAMSALIIGSVVPDCWRFLPIGVTRGESHSLPGLLWFCLPVGFGLYLLFHAALKGPLLALLPNFAFVRLGRYVRRFQSLPRRRWSAVVVSLLLGSITHLAWDAFTHEGTPATGLFPVLQATVFSIGAYPVQLCKLLQHGSAAIAIALMAWWSWRWLRSAPDRVTALPVMLTPSLRLGICAAIAVVTTVGATGYGGLALAGAEESGSIFAGDIIALQVFVRSAVFYGLRALVWAVMLYCAGWHLVRLGRWVRTRRAARRATGCPPT